MKKRSRRVLILLMSALMICGAFGLTAFADNQATHTHVWLTNSSKNLVGYKCAVEGCVYHTDKFIRIKMVANDAYSGVPYDSANIKITYDRKLPDGLKLSDPIYLDEDGYVLDNPPTEEGIYTAKIYLLVDGEETDYMYDEFTLKPFTINVDDEEFIPGGFDSESISLTDDDGVIDVDGTDLDCDFEYLSLDSKKSSYTSDEPVNAGHYRVRATLYKITETDIFAIGQATGDDENGEFEIRKLTAEDVDYDVIYLKDPTVLFKLDPEAVKFENYAQLEAIIEELEEDGYISVDYCVDNDIEGGTYGDPIIIIPHTDTVVYSPKLFGKVTAKYKKAEGRSTRTFVPGATILDAGNYKLTVTIKASRNNEKIVSEDIPVIIEKAEPKWIVEPTGKKGLVFNDRYQKLVNPGKAIGGTVKYGFVDAVDDEPDKWSTTVPSAKKAGLYVIACKAVSNNKNYTGETDVEYLEVKIVSKEEPDPLAPGKVTSVTVINKTKDGATIKFKKVKDATSYNYVVTDMDGEEVDSGIVSQKVTTYIKKDVKDLEPNKKYTVKVRAVKTVDDEEHYGKWSKTVTFKTKK